jgi:hypothetical protein
MKKAMRFVSLFSFAGLLLAAATPASALVVSSDVVTIGTGGSSTGTTVDVPVYIRDLSGSPLGIDQPAGSRIQSYSIKVTYSPTAPIQSVTFTRAGITSALTPTIELTPATPGTISLLDTFPESTNLIPFTSNAAVPGDLVGHLVFTLAPGAVPGTVVTLTLDPTLTELTDEGGSPGTKETVGNGTLTLVNGSFVVPAGGVEDVPTLDPRLLALLAVLLVFLGVRAVR